MQEEKTHLDVLIEQAKEESLKDRFLKNKIVFLIDRLAKIQEDIDKKNIDQNYGYLAMLLYIFRYIKKEVGKDLADNVFKALSFTNWNFDVYKDLLNAEDEEKEIDILAEKFIKEENFKIEKEVLKSIIRDTWRDLLLERDFEFDKEVEKIRSYKKKLYMLLNSDVEKERRKIVEFLKEKKAFKVDLKLMNIGIVPTERCVNNCRFCLVDWKPSLEERGVDLTDEDFKRIADEVIKFAGKHGLIVTVTGGEPFLALDRVLYILKKAKTRVDITTSAFWAETKEKAGEIISKLIKAAKKNKNPKFWFTLQLSLDAFHQEVYRRNGEFKENVPLKNIANIIELSQKKFKELEVVLLTKYTRYQDPIVYLIKELEKRGFKPKITRKIYDKNFKISIYEKGEFKHYPALMRAYMSLGYGKEILIFYTAVESIGKASIMHEFEFPYFRKRVKDFFEGKNPEKLPVIGFEVSDDGNVYPGAHAIFTYSIGNVLKSSLDDIFEFACYDPLIIFLSLDPKKIVDIAVEVEKGLEVLKEKASSPFVAVYKILERPSMRLYITKKLIETMYPRNVVEELKNNFNFKDIKKEYYKNKEEEDVFIYS